MQVNGVSGISGVNGIPQIAPVSKIGAASPDSAVSSIEKIGGTYSVNPAKGSGKTEPVDVTLTVQTVDDVRAMALEKHLQQQATIRAHSLYLRGTAKLAQKYNDNNAFLYDATGNKHLFDAAGQVVDVKR